MTCISQQKLRNNPLGIINMLNICANFAMHARFFVGVSPFLSSNRKQVNFDKHSGTINEVCRFVHLCDYLPTCTAYCNNDLSLHPIGMRVNLCFFRVYGMGRYYSSKEIASPSCPRLNTQQTCADT